MTTKEKKYYTTQYNEKVTTNEQNNNLHLPNVIFTRVVILLPLLRNLFQILVLCNPVAATAAAGGLLSLQFIDEPFMRVVSHSREVGTATATATAMSSRGVVMISVAIVLSQYPTAATAAATAMLPAITVTAAVIVFLRSCCLTAAAAAMVGR